MMEFKATIRIDTQDPKLAYNELRQSLQYCGLDVAVSDDWTLNMRPVDRDEACEIAANWNMTHDQMDTDKRITFKAEDSDRWQKACIAAHNAISKAVTNGGW